MRRWTVLWLLALMPAAQAQLQVQSSCGAAIKDFRRVIDADVQTGNLNKSVHARIGPQLAPVAEACSKGRDAEAMRALHALKNRFGYR